MYQNQILSMLKEERWFMKLKYPNISTGWLMVLLPFIWFPRLLWNFIEESNGFVKGMIIAIALILLGLITFIYTIVGEPNQKQWEREIFPQHIAQIVTKVYDSDNNMIGGLSNKKLKETNKKTFYVESLPPLYWSMLKFREENHLEFNNRETGFWGMIKNYRSFNGVDPVGVPTAISTGRGGSSLSQQLVKNFYGQDYFLKKTDSYYLNTLIRKWTELNEAKTFYHNLKANDGEEFKRWIAMYQPSLVSNGSVYGIDSASAVVFGKKPKDLTDLEQIILSEMYKFTYYFSEKVNEKKCKTIKKWAKRDISKYFKGQDKKIIDLKNGIDAWSCPKEPRVPFGFYRDMKTKDAKGKEVIGNPNNRIWEWAGTSASTLQSELNRYRKEHKNRLITEVKMSVDVPKNIKFKDGINLALEKVENYLENRLYVNLDGDKEDKRPQANIWVSVVDKEGEIKYIYKRGNVINPRRVGSVSKVFEAIALGNRGDKWNYYYCNEPYKGLHNSNGEIGGECKNNSNHNIYSAKKVFGASKNLPMKSALEKYVLKDTTGIRVIKDRVSDKRLKQIYKSFNLSRDTNSSSMRYELSFGMTNSSPLNLQKSIHKLTHLLYSKGSYSEAHITKSVKYKNIKNFTIQKGGETTKLYKTNISKETKELFDTNTKIYMQTVLKSALNPHYGTLRTFNKIPNFENMFMKSGSTDKPINGETRTQSKWVAGAIKVKGELYSFVIMVHSENGIGRGVKHSELSKVIFGEIVKTLNRLE